MVDRRLRSVAASIRGVLGKEEVERLAVLTSKKSLALDAYFAELLGTLLWVFGLCLFLSLRSDGVSYGTKPVIKSQSSFFENDSLVVITDVNRRNQIPSTIMDNKFMPMSDYGRIKAGATDPGLFEATCLPGMGIGLLLAVLFYWFVDVSGGHFNPAVTYAWWLSDTVPMEPERLSVGSQMGSVRATLYIMFQYTGAITGCYAARRLTGYTGVPHPAEPHSFGTAFAGECVGTAVFVYVVLLVGNARRQRPKGSLVHKLYGIICGASFAFAACLVAPITADGPALNPALSSSLLSSHFANGWTAMLTHWVDFVPYWMGPYAGATLATILYRGRALQPRVILRALFYTGKSEASALEARPEPSEGEASVFGKRPQLTIVKKPWLPWLRVRIGRFFTKDDNVELVLEKQFPRCDETSPLLEKAEIPFSSSSFPCA